MKIDFNDNWTFYKEGEEKNQKYVNLPHDAMFTEERYLECNNGGRTAYFPGGKYVYEKEFTIPVLSTDKYIAILFEGVYMRSVVYINGYKVARNSYGYTEFEVPISEHIVGGTNYIKVTVDNSLTPNSRWYSGSGIYRPVSLIIKDKNYIRDVQIKTKQISPAVIEVKAAYAENAVVTIFDGEEEVLRGTLGVIDFPNAKLWSDTSPNLYKAVIETQSDKVEVKFGVRSLDWSPTTGLLVNGVETNLRGCCIHHDNGILGACGFKDAEERKIRIIKESGYNAIRSAHNPCSRAMLDACDKYGIYVMDEAFDGWYTPKSYHDYGRDFMDNYKQDLVAMVKKDMNHPSVIMYSIGNEVTEPAEQRGIDLTKEMVDIMHGLDESRPVTCGVNMFVILKDMGHKDDGPYKREPLPDSTSKKKKKKKESGSTLYNLMVSRIGPIMSAQVKSKKADDSIKDMASHLDIVGFNYAESRYDIDGKLHPERIIVGSETMASRTWYNWPRVKKYKYLIGDFVWAGFDYIGETEPNLGYWEYLGEGGLQLFYGGGTIDATGNRDAENYYQQVIFGTYDKPYIGVRPVNRSGEKIKMAPWRMTNALDSWSWNGYEGKKSVVEVYADAASVELRLNGKRIGRKKVKKYMAIFNCKYHSGKLEAISFDKTGKELKRSELVTAQQNSILTVDIENRELIADGQSLSFLSIAITDEDGVVKPAEDTKVMVNVEGSAANLLALGSSNPKTVNLFDKEEHTTYRGRALAVIRAGYEPGEVKVTVSAEGFESKTIRINVTENSLEKKPTLIT
ncbi:glycoside hydrolase family 2 TIM barrel-domain containing protein [Robertmurraya sp. P23]|uniref:glycoside hydrolase family 2 TIM barrel-domain containing protein n=1 Tax=Robertmurraya sp. P23 TaxID=3436931 RepID=UPI003D99CCCC